MSLVGIIANPESGKDIRRIVSQAITFDNRIKVQIVRQLLTALDVCGVNKVEIMPDRYGIGQRILEDPRSHEWKQLSLSLVEMECRGTAEDSSRAAEHFAERGANCIVVLGGDGTCRVVAQGAPDIPLLPISTGTNNIVPSFIDGSIAGLAAAYITLHPGMPRERLCWRHKKLVIRINGRKEDEALIDMTIIDTRFMGSRAVWNVDSIRQLFVTQAHPRNVGLSSVVGLVHPVDRHMAYGASVQFRDTNQTVVAPITPGCLESIHISEVLSLEPNVLNRVYSGRPAVVALDGERELKLRSGDEAEVILKLDGPWIVDIDNTLEQAVADRFFVTDSILKHDGMEETDNGN